MSVQATTWVWTRSEAQDNTLLVALAIADAANAQGAESCQSVRTICRMTRASETTVHRAIRWLLDAHEIEYVGVNPRYGNTRVYRFPALWPADVPRPAAIVEHPPGGGADMAGGTTGDTGGVPSEPSGGAVGGTQPHKNTPGTTTPTPPDGDGGSGEPLSSPEELFVDFWEHYPKKVSRKDAVAAFAKALKSTGYEVIRAGLVSAIKTWRDEGKVTVESKSGSLVVKVAPGEAGKGVPHAATWLNGERWNDEHPGAKAAAGTDGEGSPAWMTRRSE